MKDFKGKYVLITGGSKGIGKDIAKFFFEKGATVLICSRNKEEIKITCKDIDPEGINFFGIKADVSKISDCKKLIDYAIKKFGKIDVLINNAGIIGEIGEFDKNNIINWSKAIEVNLLGSAYCSRFALPFMKKNSNGKIINFAGAGVGGKNPLINFSSYYTSKIAIVGFTETIAEELKKYNIQVNCIAPGQINTGITDYVISQGLDKVGKDIYKQTIEQKKKGVSSTRQITDLISFLCSSEADHITGRLLSVKWDKIEVLKRLTKEGGLFKLRRIDNDLFYGK